MVCAQSHILLIDAQPRAHRRLRALLASSSGRYYAMTAVDTLQAALAFLSQNEVDVVLLDLKLPDVSGLSAYYQLAAAHARLPIIILTPVANKHVAKKVIRAGAQDYLIKEEVDGLMLRRSIRYAVARKRAEWDYKTVHERFRGIYESSRDAMGYMTTQGIPLDVNDAFCSLTGYTKCELLDSDCYQNLTPDSYRPMEKNTTDVVLATGDSAEYEKELVCKDGSLVPVMVTLFVVRSACGVVDGLAVIIKDVSERKKIDKLKNDFIASVSHELRTPLTIVHAGVENLRDNILGDMPAKHMEVVNHIHGNLKHLIQMINDLLDLSRLEASRHKIRRTATNMMLLVQNVVRSIETQACQLQVMLSCEIPKQLSVLDVDSAMIGKVLYNLIDNALRFARSKVQVSVEKLGSGTHDGVRISVYDDGAGIPESEMERLFTKFEQHGHPEWERGRQGTGIGLAICREIVEQHKGKIWMENIAGGGSAFHVMLLPNEVVDPKPEEVTSEVQETECTVLKLPLKV